jgi:hypothetical protein
MSFLIISTLVALSAYLGFRLNATKSEIALLQASVASLKRQLRG